MKKILATLVVAFSSFVAMSQVSFTGTTHNPTGAVLNATVDTLNFRAVATDVDKMSVQVLLARSTGTVAGTVRLYGSNYNNTAGAWEAVGDTLTLSNAATNVFTWTLSPPTYKYYQIRQSGGTTMAGILSAKVWFVK